MPSLKYRVQQLRAKFQLAVGAALCFSFYSYYVEWKGELNPSQRFLCDISDHISCSKAFNSEYGKGFGLVQYIFGKESIFNQPNSVYGALFYIAILLLDEINAEVWASYRKCNFIEDHVMLMTRVIAICQLVMSIVSNMGSVYLAYILIFKLNNLCVVCASMYVFNAYILYCSYHKLQLLQLIYIKNQRAVAQAFSIIRTSQLK